MAKVPSIPIDYPGFQGMLLSRLYIDGQPLEDLQALYALNTQAFGASKWNAPNRFWATPERSAQAKNRDVLEVALTTPALINRFSFQVSNFPCRIWLQYWHPTYHEWRPVRRRQTGRPVQVTIAKSVPRRIHADVFDRAHRHHQHRGAGHWETIDVYARPIKTSRIRMVLTHLPSRHPPVNQRNQPIPYSLAVQDLQFGYRVAHWKDIPYGSLKTQSEADFTAFSSSTDLLGSPVEFGVRQYRASDMLWPVREAIDGVVRTDRQHDADIWKCEPQPFSYAVVNLYVDARDGLGLAQSVDRFYVDPTTSGVSTNLYYSNDTPAYLSVEAADDEIRYPGLKPSGEVSKDGESVVFPDDYGYLDLRNQMIQWMWSEPWWVGLSFLPQFDSTSLGTYQVLDSAPLSITFRDGFFNVRIHGVELVCSERTFGINDEIRMVVSWDNGQASVSFFDGWSAEVGAPPLTKEEILAQTGGNSALSALIRFGARRDPGGDVGIGNYRLRHLVLKREQYLPEIVDYLAYPEPYLVKPSIEDDEVLDRTDNAILRVHPSFQTPGIPSATHDSVNPYGFVGGAGNIYADLIWTPISRDFVLHKGDLKFDPVKAKYFKFEFTNLVGQPYSSPTPVRRRVKMFSSTSQSLSRTVAQAPGGETEQPLGGSGAGVNQSLAANRRFLDQNRTRTTPNPYGDYGPTEALYSSDPVAQERLQKLTPLFGLQPWHQADRAPRFTRTQKHVYEVVEVEHKSKVAYFVGLNQVRMFKVDYATADDTEAYLFLFHDDSNLTPDLPTPWRLDPAGGLVSPAGLDPGYQDFVLTSSEPLNSRRNVRAIQFATAQTPATQRLLDPDFNDETLVLWQPYGGATITPSDDLNTDIGTTILVSRSQIGAYWNYLETRYRTETVPYSTWDAIEDSDPDARKPTWNDLEDSENTGQTSVGGVESLQMVELPPRGRVYAAARAYAPNLLHGPLHLQIVGEDGQVLSDEVTVATPGQVIEWYTGYTIGEGGAVAEEIPEDSNTWDELEALGDWDDVEALGTWNDVEGFEPGYIAPGFEGYTGKVFARLVQQGATDDEFFVDNISIYEDSVIWEFSNDSGVTWWPAYDIRNNPDGVLLFPETASEGLAVEEETALRWRVQGYRPGLHINALLIRPWYSSMHLGVLSKQGLEHGGPNQTPYDQYPDIYDSPPFKTWHKPIPEDWWFAHRQWLLRQRQYEAFSLFTGTPGENVLSDGFIYTQGVTAEQALFDAFVYPGESTTGTWVPYLVGTVVARPFNGGRAHHDGLEVRQIGTIGNTTVSVELHRWDLDVTPPVRTLVDTASYTNTLDNVGNPELVSLGDGRFVAVQRKSDGTIKGWVIDTTGDNLTIGSQQTLASAVAAAGNSAALDADTVAISGNPSTGTTKYLWQSTITGMTGSETSEVTATGISGANGKYTPLFGVGGQMLWQKGDYTSEEFGLQLRTPAAGLLDEVDLSPFHASEYTVEYSGSRGGVDAAGHAVVAESTEDTGQVTVYTTTGDTLTEVGTVAVSSTGYVQMLARLGQTGSRFVLQGYSDGTSTGFLGIVDTTTMTAQNIPHPEEVDPANLAHTVPIDENAFLVTYDANDDDAEYIYRWETS